MILDTAIYIFVALELSNILIMYFKPDFKYGNSMIVFKEWQRSKQHEANFLLLSYLVRWVANCKLFFIALLLLVALSGSESLKVTGIVVTIVSIGIYFISLHPLLKKLDQLGELEPVGYSKRLAVMIASFITMFAIALLLHFTTRI